MSYNWYNDGKRNKKIYIGEKIPIGFTKGYIIVKNKIERLKKVNKSYENELKLLEKNNKERLKKRKEKLEKKLKKKQNIIFPDLS